jgi:hypothetical protein
MKLFPGKNSTYQTGTGLTTPGLTRRMTVIASGVVAFGLAGTLVVLAGDNPEIYQTFLKFNRPVRQAVEPYLPRPQVQLPQIFQRRNTVPVEALSYAPRLERLQAPSRLRPEPSARTAVLPAATLPAISPDATPAAPSTRGRHKLNSRSEGRGAQVATNYCVRLCDGFAFPIGNAGGSNWNIQETACRSACPGAETALFYSPAGAKDLDSLTRGRLSYTALPTAFRYREKLTNACSCRPVGATQSSMALLTDYTLRKGDLAMTRVGARHFDGARSFPFQASNFSEALGRLKSRKEVEIVRAMEVASVRGILSEYAPDKVRQRVIADIQSAEKLASRARPAEARGGPRGLVELTARERRGPVALRPVKRAPGLVALN